MAKKYLHFLFTIILFLALKTGFCSHVPGGNITYECLGNNRYYLLILLRSVELRFISNNAQFVQLMVLPITTNYFL